MIATSLQPRIESALAEEVELRPISENEAQIYVPFYFPDGDGLVVHVRGTGHGLEITDRAHTLLHLSYHTEIDRLRNGTRAAIFERIRARHGIEDRDGEMVLDTSEERVGTDVFTFVQALLEISDLRNLDREIARSTFRDDLKELLEGAFPDIIEQYSLDEHDGKHEYLVPYVLNGTKRPIGIFDIGTDDAALKAIVVVQKFQSWGVEDMQFVAIEQDQEKLQRGNVSWLSNAFDKQFAALQGQEEAILAYLRREWDISKRLSQA